MDYFGKAAHAVDEHTEQAASEKLKLKLMEYITDKNIKKDPILKEYLESIEGCTEIREDESEDNSGGYIVVIDGYEFRVSADGKLLESLGKATSPLIIVIPKGKNIDISITERGESVTSLEILDSANENSVIKSVTKEDMTKNEESYGFTYQFNTDGIYVLKVTTQEGNTYTRKITIDSSPPSTPVISSNYGYPLITSTGIILQQDGMTTITYDENDNIENYYSFDNTSWTKYNGPINCVESQTIYAKSVKKSNGTESTASKKISTPSDAVPWSRCSSGAQNFVNVPGPSKTYYLNAAEESWGKKFNIEFGFRR